MARLPAVDTLQPQLPFIGNAVPAGEHTGVDPTGRITLRRLLGVISSEIEIIEEPTIKDFEGAEPTKIEQLLYVYPLDRRYRDTKQPVVIISNNGLQPTSDSRIGVLFPVEEFSTVARNARDLARHTFNKTRNANKTLPDREERDEISRRSVIHALTGKVVSMQNLLCDYDDENKIYKSLFKDLKTDWIAHQKSSTLDVRREFVDQKIHANAELAAMSINLGNLAVDGIHNAIRKNLYGGNKSSSEQAHIWQRYIAVNGRHNNAKAAKLQLSIEQTNKIAEIYKFNEAKTG